jgi:hypothetical protein
MKAEGASADKIQKQANELAQFKQQYNNPVIMALYTFIEPLPVAILVSLVCAFIVKRKRRESMAAVSA